MLTERCDSPQTIVVQTNTNTHSRRRRLLFNSRPLAVVVVAVASSTVRQEPEHLHRTLTMPPFPFEDLRMCVSSDQRALPMRFVWPRWFAAAAPAPRRGATTREVHIQTSFRLRLFASEPLTSAYKGRAAFGYGWVDFINRSEIAHKKVSTLLLTAMNIRCPG